MAKPVFTTEEIELMDGTTLMLKPNSIKGQKEFMKVMSQMQEVKTEDDMLGVVLQAVAVCLKKWNAAYASVEYLEDVVDIETAKRIIKVCGGVDFDDPKLVTAATEALIAGQN